MNNQALALVGPQNAQANAMTFAEKVKYCEVLSQADMLPDSYRKKPANVLIALELGATVGVPAVVAMMEIYVVNGRPAMSSKLMNALVRQAGHSIRIDSQDTQATCRITRRDDPHHEFKSTFSLQDAQAAGLDKKDLWVKYQRTMLVNRAVSSCVRLACPEVIMGLAYTPEELGDDGRIEVIHGEIVDSEKRPAQEPDGDASYRQIKTAQPQPVAAAQEQTTQPRKTRKEKATEPQPEPEPKPQATGAGWGPDREANFFAPTEDPPATDEARSEALMAWKALYGWDPETGEKAPQRAQDKFAEIFPGWQLKNATVSQVAAVLQHCRQENDKMSAEVPF